MLGATETLGGTIVKVCRGILFFNSFFLISSAPCPMKTAKQSRYFCVLKYAGQAIKKRSRAKLNTEGETGEKS